MKKSPETIRTLVLFFLAALILLGPAAAVAQDEDEAEARKARILGNLKLQFPQLEEMQVTMGDIEPTEFEGLDQGSFAIAGRGGPQKFLVSRDDTKLYMVAAGPFDVSRSEEAIKAAVAEREAAKQREAAERQAKLAGAAEGAPSRGNPEAPVVIVEFSEFQCPYCAKGANTVAEVLQKYPDDVKFVFKHFPLDFHNWAKPAAIASHCAAEQSADAFWKLHDQYFKNQRALTAANVLEKSKEYLQDTEVDMALWSTCAEDTASAEYQAASAAVDADTALGKQLGVTGTPGFFVNGQFLKGAVPVAQFDPLIRAAVGGGPDAPAPPGETEAVP
jgi:protein-disulfide isomerase